MGEHVLKYLVSTTQTNLHKCDILQVPGLAQDKSMYILEGCFRIEFLPEGPAIREPNLKITTKVENHIKHAFSLLG